MKNAFKKCLVCYEGLSAGEFYHSKCAKSLFGTATPPRAAFGLADVEHLAKEVINRSLAVPGVQRKLAVSLHHHHDEVKDSGERVSLIGVFGGDFILKPPSNEYPEMPELEQLSMKLAGEFGVKTAEHGLIVLNDGTLAYLTKRFDRREKEKIPVEDLCQLSETLSENKYKSTSERLGKVVKQFCSHPGDDSFRLFELLLFSFLTGNADMHLKNFSLVTLNDITSLSPCYDLLSTRLLISEKDDPEELALPLNGKKRNIRRRDFVEFGKNLLLPEKVVEKLLSRCKTCLDDFSPTIRKAILSEKKKQEFLKLIQKRSAALA